MPMPWTYRHASKEWRAFLDDVKDRTGLESDNMAYTAIDAVFQVFRRRLTAEQGLRFASILPAVPRAIFIKDWRPEAKPPPFPDRAALIREVRAVRPDHNLTPDNAIEATARALRRSIDQRDLDDLLADLPPGAQIRQRWPDESLPDLVKREAHNRHAVFGDLRFGARNRVGGLGHGRAKRREPLPGLRVTKTLRRSIEQTSGVAFALLAVCLFTPVFAAGRFLDAAAAGLVLIWLRYLSGAATLVLFVFVQRRPIASLRSAQPVRHALRALLGAAAGACAIEAAARMPVAEAAAVPATAVAGEREAALPAGPL